VVVDSPCNEKFTYQIFGSEVKYLGVGDSHDRKYGYLERIGKPADFTTSTTHKEEYSGLPLIKDSCPYTLYLYPSELMKSDFKTSNGAVFMVSTFVIFIFTSMVFYIYDWKVQQRQNRVTSTARQSSAILSSLFPSNVRDQLYETEEEEVEIGTDTKRLWGLPHAQFSHADDHLHERAEASPIAQLYEDTTVVFMDIVGFTQWSSTRQPTEVFLLLETLYAKFDALAKVHGVFKIETIGDCYVAVVGLPSKRKRHAVVMATFASECRESMMGILQKLEETLGPVRYAH
jgi:Adenylate and Guanylate cyclase catalytic domain